MIKYRSHVHIKSNKIIGWIFDKDDMEKVISIDIHFNGNPVAKLKCDLYRGDLKTKRNHPTGLCGFEYKISNLISSNKLNVIEVFVSNENILLKNSPFLIDNRKKNNRILVVGLNKSGTSILAYRIASGLKTNKIYFEPKSKESLSHYNHHIGYTESSNIVTKSLYHQGYDQAFTQISQLYDKKVWIVRDPRDVIISSFFYHWYKGHNKPEELFNLAYSRTLAKEKSPLEISFSEMLDGIMDPKKYMNGRYNGLIKMIKKLDKSWLIIKYEDFIDQNLEHLNQYLGFRVDTSAEVNPRVNRVSRSKAYGNWRKWFIKSEIKKMKEIFNPALENLNYDINNWEVEDNNVLDPKEGSEYMYKLRYD